MDPEIISDRTSECIDDPGQIFAVVSNGQYVSARSSGGSGSAIRLQNLIEIYVGFYGNLVKRRPGFEDPIDSRQPARQRNRIFGFLDDPR